MRTDGDVLPLSFRVGPWDVDTWLVETRSWSEGIHDLKNSGENPICNFHRRFLSLDRLIHSFFCYPLSSFKKLE